MHEVTNRPSEATGFHFVDYSIINLKRLAAIIVRDNCSNDRRTMTISCFFLSPANKVRILYLRYRAAFPYSTLRLWQIVDGRTMRDIGHVLRHINDSQN